jgi:hypothetical protein
MGLKGYRLWVMGQLDSNEQSPNVDRHTGCYQLSRVLVVHSRGVSDFGFTRTIIPAVIS